MLFANLLWFKITNIKYLKILHSQKRFLTCAYIIQLSYSTEK